MNLVVKRTTFTPVSTGGEMFIDGQHFCYTIERPSSAVGSPEALIGPDGKNHPCIPVGLYKTQRVVYDHLGLLCFELQDVPGRTSILIHPANWAKQLLGCIAVGVAATPDAISGSDNAYVQLMGRTAGQDVTVEVAEG